MEKEIIFDYKPNIDELVKSYYYSIYKSWKIRLFSFFILFIILFNLIVEIFQKQNINFFDFLPLIFVPAFLYYMIRRIYAKNKKTFAKDPKLNEKRHLIFNNESMTYSGQTFIVKYLWNEFIEIEETKKWFLLYLGDYRAFTIIKNDLNTDQINELKELFYSLNIKKSLS